MRRIGFLSAGVLLLLFSTASIAQADNWGGMTNTQFQTGSWADATGYYFAVRYRGNRVPDIQVRIIGRVLEIVIGQASGMPGGFFANRMSQSYPLPMDADPSRMRRQEQPGLVLFRIPRRQVSYPQRW